MIYQSTASTSGLLSIPDPPLDGTYDLTTVVGDLDGSATSSASSGAPAGAVDGTVGLGTADLIDLTPDALMAYCQSRLDSIGTQADGIMAQQERSNSESSAMQTVIQLFQQHSSGVNDAATCQQLETSLYDLITNLKQTDKSCPELGKLTQTYNDLLYSGTGPIDQGGVNLPYIDEDTYPPDTSTPKGDDILGSTEMQTYVTDLQGCASDLNSDSEIQMIQLQSLMSQRQTAVELTTNLVQSLGDQADKIAENVGH